MRTTLLFSLALFWATPAFGQQVEDRIVVTAKTAELKVQDEIVGTVPQGSILTVEKVQGDLFRLRFSSGKGTTMGWIRRQDVLPFENALESAPTSCSEIPLPGCTPFEGRFGKKNVITTGHWKIMIRRFGSTRITSTLT